MPVFDNEINLVNELHSLLPVHVFATLEHCYGVTEPDEQPGPEGSGGG